MLECSVSGRFYCCQISKLIKMQVSKFNAWTGGEMLLDIIPVNESAVITHMQNPPPKALVAYRHDIQKILKSTSIVDSTDKEVFDGDILEHIYDERLFKWLVVDMGYGFFIRNIGVDKRLGDCFQVTDKSFFLSRRVIGNICQTPEMLSL